MRNILEITRFASPALLWLLAVVAAMVALYVIRLRKDSASVRMSTIKGAPKHNTPKLWLRHLPFALRCLAVATLIIALARPQSSRTSSHTMTEGIDIVLSLDISGSMLARDFQPDRMEAAKLTAAQFIAARPNDRIGLVLFAGESFTQSPLTTDRATLQMLLAQAHIGIVTDGTAIGNGLATAINRLKESDAQSKVIILLTDGVNNAGQIAPLMAAELAHTMGVRVYTIGVGTRGTAPMPAYDAFGRMVFVDAPVEIDEEMLQQIASATGGEYFRATDNNSLEQVYARIDQLEKSRIETSDATHYSELYALWALLALALLVLEFFVKKFIVRQLP